jgi:hypothetical protein
LPNYWIVVGSEENMRIAEARGFDSRLNEYICTRRHIRTPSLVLSSCQPGFAAPSGPPRRGSIAPKGEDVKRGRM